MSTPVAKKTLLSKHFTGKRGRYQNVGTAK